MSKKKAVESKRTYVVRHLRIVEDIKSSVRVATAKTLEAIRRDNAGLHSDLRVGDVVWRIFPQNDGDPFCSGAIRFRSGDVRARLVWFDARHKLSVDGRVELRSPFPDGTFNFEHIALVDEKGRTFSFVTGRLIA